MIKRKYIFALVIILVVILLAVTFLNYIKERKVFMADTNVERIEFLQGYGWQIKNDPIEIEEVLIPLEFDDVWLEYNKIQREAGFNLESFAGKQAIRYTYEVLNHVNANGKQVRANILVCEGQIIGGDVMTVAIDGFMHALNKKE